MARLLFWLVVFPIPQLLSAGMAKAAIRKTVAALEGDQSAVCPECGQLMPGKDRPAHLIRAHGYLEVGGVLMPRPKVVALLWDRVFQAGDGSANDLLFQLLGTDTNAEGESAYRDALEAELLRRVEGLFAARWQTLPRLVQALRQSEPARRQFRGLLRASDARVREVGRELFLPDACAALTSPETTPAEARRWLDRLCPLEEIAERVRFCRRLAQHGADAAAVAALVQELREEKPVQCPECRTEVPRSQLDRHLRLVHRVYEFKGIRRPLGEMVEALLDALCCAEPDPEAWHILQALAQDEHGPQAVAFLATSFSEALGRLSLADRTEAVTALARTLVAAEGAAPLAIRLAADPQPAARHLALALGARLPSPLEASLVAALRPLLLDTRLPEGAQVEAAVALVRTTGPSGPATQEVLGAFVAGLKKVRAIERLRKLREKIDHAPAVDEMWARLEDQLRMRCPRCATELRRREMVKHLWLEHRLVLDGRRVREPWQMIEDWLEDSQRTGSSELVERARALAQRIDPEGGLLRVCSLVLAKGIADAAAEQLLLAEAETQGMSVCPDCYSLVPIRREPGPFALSIGRGRLSARGYQVEVKDRGLIPRVEIETPHGFRVQAREPDRRVTRKGLTLLLAGPPTVLAVMLAFGLPVSGPLLVPVVGLLWLALVGAVGVRLLWKEPTDTTSRAVDYAWSWLVPQLHAGGFSLEDSGFVAGLAQKSLDLGRSRLRARALESIIKTTEKAITQGAVHHLGALRRLAIEDATNEAGQDPVPPLVAELGRCFDGKLSLAYAEGLLAGWKPAGWTGATRARLRVLACDRAFEAGFEVRNLIDLGHTSPALAEALRTDDPQGLAMLRLLWALRARRPWDSCGEAVTVFTLAADVQQAKQLGKFPDLLLSQSGDRRLEAEICLCTRGILFQEILFATPPRTSEIISKRRLDEGGYELALDGRRFWFPTEPDAVLARLERWFRFYFREFVPQVAEVHNWQSPSVAATLRAHQMVHCPECERVLLTRAGEMAVALNEEA